MQGEQLTPNPEQPTLVHGQEPIVVSQPGDPGHEAKVAEVEANNSAYQGAVESMRATTAAQKAVAEAQMNREMAPGAITEMPKFSETTETTTASEPDLKRLEEIKANGLKQRHQRYFRKPWQVITDHFPWVRK